MNTIDISNESLEDAFATMPLYSNVYYATLKDWAKACLKHGANWQKEKDKALHDKLIQLLSELRTAVSFLDSVDTRTAEANAKANYFLTQLQK